MNGMNDMQQMIENFRKEVELVITGLDRFTSVMQAISDIKKTAVRAEVRYTTYQVSRRKEIIIIRKISLGKKILFHIFILPFS